MQILRWLIYKKQSVVQFYEYIVAYFKDYKKNL